MSEITEHAAVPSVPPAVRRGRPGGTEKGRRSYIQHKRCGHRCDWEGMRSLSSYMPCRSNGLGVFMIVLTVPYGRHRSRLRGKG
jgi:hypothetical protein